MRHVVCLILGGGKGTRLLPLTEVRSKPAVPVGGKYRLIDVPISNCINSGINKMYVLTQFNSVSLHRHIRQTYNFDLFHNGYVEILAAQQTLNDVNWYQGTADAVRKQLHVLKEHGNRYVLILSGDQLYRMDFRRMLATHVNNKAGVTISTVPVTADAARGFGIMQLDSTGRVNGFVEKPKDEASLDKVRTPAEWINQQGIEANGREYLASMGIYLWDRDLLVDLLESTDYEDFGRDIFPMAIKHHHVQTHLFDGYWEDIGTIKAFFDANLALADTNPPFRFADRLSPIFTRPRFLPSTRMESCTIRQSLVADGCTIGEGASVDRCVLGMRTHLGSNVTLKNVVMMGADFYPENDSFATRSLNGPVWGIGDNAYIDGALLDKNVCVGRNARIVASEAPSPNCDCDEVYMRDGIAVVRKNARIPDNWSFANRSQ
ncbi:MAG: glucose-1-phosphate adenylyltransferase [Planctomycetaceae bacterium]|nr:glucose-1-phosphate adenylyltransferase [Planctomycetaceae bacterium]